jgi:hypothetical protein
MLAYGRILQRCGGHAEHHALCRQQRLLGRNETQRIVQRQDAVEGREGVERVGMGKQGQQGCVGVVRRIGMECHGNPVVQGIRYRLQSRQWEGGQIVGGHLCGHQFSNSITAQNAPGSRARMH